MRRDQVGAPVLALQGQHALLPAGVEVAVPDEVQHVPLPVQQQALEVRPRRTRRPVQLCQALTGGPGQRAGQLALFLLHVQGGQPAGGGNHAQDPQRRPDPQRSRHRGDRDVADQLVPPADDAPAPWSYIASHGSPASAGVSMRSTTRSPSPRSAATAAAARYRPATSPVPSSPANSTCPASRTGCSVSGSTRRLDTAEASTAACSSPRCSSSDSASSSAVADASPAGDATTSTLNSPGAPPGPIATSMTVMTSACPYPVQPAPSPQSVIFPPPRPDLPGDAGPGRNRAAAVPIAP